jgi:hypothetical protein
MHGIKDTLLLNATAVSDFKKVKGESTLCNNLNTAFSNNNQYRNPPCCGANKRQKWHYKYSLLIFIVMHSQESQFHNKCLFCFDKVHIYVQIPPFCLRVQSSNPNALCSRSKFKVLLQFVETCQTMYRINLYDVIINLK